MSTLRAFCVLLSEEPVAHATGSRCVGPAGLAALQSTSKQNLPSWHQGIYLTIHRINHLASPRIDSLEIVRLGIVNRDFTPANRFQARRADTINAGAERPRFGSANYFFPGPKGRHNPPVGPSRLIFAMNLAFDRRHLVQPAADRPASGSKQEALQRPYILTGIREF